MKTIKNIIFDLGNIILKDKPCIVLNDLNIDNDLKLKIKNSFFGDWDDLDKGKIDIVEKFYRSNLENDVSEEVKNYLLNYYIYRPLNENIMNLINKLREKDYHIFVLSNNNKNTKEYLNKLDFFERLDGCIYSCDYGIMKPDCRLYKVLLEKYNLKPEECFFIDDNPINIKAGELLGIKGFVLDWNENDIDDLMKELEKNYIILD